jgi:hypothetical protein
MIGWIIKGILTALGGALFKIVWKKVRGQKDSDEPQYPPEGE